MSNPTAAMLVIGDEILSGRTRDANMYHLAGRLAEKGIDLKEARVVSDDQEAIVRAVNALRHQVDMVFTSGGIGPTHDDITADCIAAAFEISIDVRQDALEMLAANYKNGVADINQARMRMARIPEGAILIANPISNAPGFSVENVHVLAGVPNIFQIMLDDVLPRLTSGKKISNASIRIMRPEGEIAGPLAEIATRNPDVSIGSYPFISAEGFGSNLVVRGLDENRVQQVEHEICEIFQEFLS